MYNIIINSDSRYAIDKNIIREVVATTLRNHKITGKVEVGINIIGDRKMHQLNKQYRGIDSTTDILSFALEDTQSSLLRHIPQVGFVSAPDRILRLGDIVLSYPQIMEDASLDGVSVEEEFKVLLEHGIKHLLGIHHE